MAELRYYLIPIEECNDPLVDIVSYPFVSEPAYYRQGLADNSKIFMRKIVAEKLAQLQETTLQGYRFKIWDAWRPRSVQDKIYDRYWREMRHQHPDWSDAALEQEIKNYVSSPDVPGKIPQHATGGAVDLTLVDLKDGREVDMGTGFDHFGIEANPYYYEEIANNISGRENRRLLISSMAGVDFCVDPDEWWHFDYGNQKWAEKQNKKVAIYCEILIP